MSPEEYEEVAVVVRKARQQGREEAMLAMKGVLSRLPHAGGQILAVELQNAVRGLEKL